MTTKKTETTTDVEEAGADEPKILGHERIPDGGTRFAIGHSAVVQRVNAMRKKIDEIDEDIRNAGPMAKRVKTFDHGLEKTQGGLMWSLVALMVAVEYDQLLLASAVSLAALQFQIDELEAHLKPTKGAGVQN